MAAFLAHTTRGQALDDDLEVDIDEQSGVQRALQLGQHGVKSHSLRGGTRETVQDDALLGVRLLDALLHQIDDQIIGNQLAGIHEALGLNAQGSLILNGSAKEGETGRRRITQVTRYLTLALGLINAIGYLLLFKSPQYGVVFSSEVPEVVTDILVVFTLVAGTAFIMWMGELITQRGVGNGMSLIIFVSIVSRVPSAIFSSVNLTTDTGMGIAITVLILAVVLVCIPAIIFVERAQRRIPVNYAKRVQGRKMMGGQSTYIPLKVNAAGVIPIIFASCLIYFPAQLAALFNVGWLTAFADAISTGWVNWILTIALIVFFAYFYTSMVFNPEETADNLRKQGGFIPGVRPGSATVTYIKNVLHRVTLPGGIFIAVIAVVPTIIFYFTGNTLIQAFGGTSILIMIGVALDTMSKVESQLKMHNYEGFFK